MKDKDNFSLGYHTNASTVFSPQVVISMIAKIEIFTKSKRLLLLMNRLIYVAFYSHFRRNPVDWVISDEFDKKSIPEKINCLLALILCGISLCLLRELVTHFCSWTIYAFEETCLTIGSIPSTSFSSAPSAKISSNRFMKGAGESL